MSQCLSLRPPSHAACDETTESGANRTAHSGRLNFAGLNSVHAVFRQLVASARAGPLKPLDLLAMTPTSATPQVRLFEYGAHVPASWRQVLQYWWSIDGNRPGAAWRYYLATGFYNTVFSIGLTFIFWASNSKQGVLSIWWETWLISQCIGYCIHIGFDGLYRGIRPQRFAWWTPKVRLATNVALPMLATFPGYTIAFALRGGDFLGMLARTPRLALYILLIGFIISLTWFAIMDGQTRRLRAEAAEATSRAEASALQRQALDAELRALQAQIEPHFLFNTLANVQALIDYEPETAKRMLESFIEYLRATLDASRRTQATLGDELDLMTRYLNLMQVRMGTRLNYAIEVPTELRQLPFAPLLLQPLVENAIKYGLEPQIDGGTVTIHGERVGQRVTLRVDDNGAGLKTKTTARKGSGVGLKNVTERLRSMFGETATVSVAQNEVGVSSTMTFETKIVSSAQ
jgi:hypothetical protein